MVNKPENEIIQFDNQCLILSILLPSGRIQIKDKVSGIVWDMVSGSSCGSIYINRSGKEKKYTLGHKGNCGVLFKMHSYAVRSGVDEDFHEVSLTGPLGDDSESQVTIQYLFSTSNPIIDCFLHISGPAIQLISKIVFPLGLEVPISTQNHLYLPLELSLLKPLEECGPQLPLWDPVDKENHQIAGSPFFILTQAESENKSAGCIGYLQHPLCHMQIQHGLKKRHVTPITSHPDKTGCIEESPYKFRFQFFPSNDLQAIYWLCYEHLSRDLED